jgi:hypothetical protein
LDEFESAFRPVRPGVGESNFVLVQVLLSLRSEGLKKRLGAGADIVLRCITLQKTCSKTQLLCRVAGAR